MTQPYTISLPAGTTEIWFKSLSQTPIRITIQFSPTDDGQQIPLQSFDTTGNPAPGYFGGGLVVTRAHDHTVEFQIEEQIGSAWSATTLTAQYSEGDYRYIVVSGRVAQIEFDWSIPVAIPSLPPPSPPDSVTVLLKAVRIKRLDDANSEDEVYVIVNTSFPQNPELKRAEVQLPPNSHWNFRIPGEDFGAGYTLYSGPIGKQLLVLLRFIEVDTSPIDPDDQLGDIDFRVLNYFDARGRIAVEFLGGNDVTKISPTNNPLTARIIGDGCNYEIDIELIPSATRLGAYKTGNIKRLPEKHPELGGVRKVLRIHSYDSRLKTLLATAIERERQ